MLVIAKTRGEYPIGTWRDPGEKFEFSGEKSAMWMMTAEQAEEAKAKDRAEAEEASEIIKARSEAESKIKAEIKARKGTVLVPSDAPVITEEEAIALAKKTSAQLAKGIHALHKGFGRWDVLGVDGEVVESGLDKAGASALVEKLLG